MKQLYFFLLLLSTNFLFSQTIPTWVHTKNGTGENSDKYNSLVVDGSGNIYAAGYTIQSGNYKDLLLVKFNSLGDTLWTRKYNGIGDGDDKAIKVALDSLSNVYVCGVTDGGSTSNDILIRKYDPSGNLIWSYSYNYSPFNENDEPSSMFLDPSGNCYVTGKSDRDSSSVTNNDIITLRVSNGNLIWQARINGNANLDDAGVAITRNSNSILFVAATTANTTDDDIMTIQYSTAGVELFRKIYDRGIKNDQAISLTTDLSGNVYVCGKSDNATDNDFVVLKYTNAGNLSFTKIFDNGDNDNPTKILFDGTSNIYVSGQTDQISGTGSNFDMILLKYTTAGAPVWNNVYGNPVIQDDDVNDMAIDGSGNIYLTGKSDSNAVAGISNNDVITVKFNSSGTLQWAMYNYGSFLNSSDQGEALITSGTSVFIAGSVENNSSMKDAAVIKLAQSNGSKVFQKTYNGTGDFNDKATEMVMDKFNNMYVTGYVTNDGNDRDIFVEKLDMNGVSVWYKNFDYKGSRDEANSIALDTSGNIYVAGITNGAGSGNDYYILKLNSLGDTVWTRTYDYLLKNDVPVSIMPTLSGSSVYVTGYSDGSATYLKNYDIATLKYNSIGTLVTAVRYNGTGNGSDKPGKLIVSGSSVYMVGKTYNAAGNYDIVSIKYSGALAAAWTNIYNGTSNLDDDVSSFVIDANNLYVCGNTTVTGSMEDLLTYKLNSSGIQQWSNVFGGAALKTDKAYCIVANTSGIYVSGKTTPSLITDSADIVTIKYDKTTGNRLWTSNYNGTANKVDKPNSISSDLFGNIFVTGLTALSTGGNDIITLCYHNGNGLKKMIANYNGTLNGDDEGHIVLNSTTGYTFVAGYTFGSSNTQNNITVMRYCSPSVANAGTDVSICAGTSTTLNGSGGGSYLWTPASSLSSSSISNPVSHPSSSVSYIVNVDNGLGCGAYSKDTVVVTVNAAPTATIAASGSLTICNGTTITLTANSGTGYTYQWYSGTTPISSATSIAYTTGVAGTYKVKVYNSFGCAKTSKSKTVTVIVCRLSDVEDSEDSPSLEFTLYPNPSASTFIFEADNSNMICDIKIYNVLGQLVINETNVSGTFEFGKDLMDGLYMMDVDLNGQHTQIKIIKSSN